MQHKKLVACASVVILAIAAACSNGPESPVSPSGSEPGSNAAAADGSTLKATAPTPQSPVNNQQPDSMVFVAGKSTATFASPSTVFLYRVRNPQQW